MTNGTAVVYGAGVDSCVDRIVEARYANIAAYSTGLRLNGSTFAARAEVNAKVKSIHINYYDTTETVRYKMVRCNKLV